MASVTQLTTLNLLSGLGAGDPLSVWGAAWRQMATLAEAKQTCIVPGPVLPGLKNKGLSWGVIQAEGRRMVRCMEKPVHMEGRSESSRPGWHGGSGSGPHSQGGRRLLAAGEGPFVLDVSKEGRPFKG